MNIFQKYLARSSPKTIRRADHAPPGAEADPFGNGQRADRRNISGGLRAGAGDGIRGFRDIRGERTHGYARAPAQRDGSRGYARSHNDRRADHDGAGAGRRSARSRDGRPG